MCQRGFVMIKKCFLTVLLCLSCGLVKAQTADLAGAIIDDNVPTSTLPAEDKPKENVADDRGMFSFLNFSFIKKPLAVLSAQKETAKQMTDPLDELRIKDKPQTPAQQPQVQAPQETQLQRATRLAEEGDVDSALSLGYIYLYGTDDIEADYQKAFHFYELAANQNNPIALNNLGSLYFSGIGTEVDYQKASELFLKAAQNGNADAAVNLAFIYLSSGKKKYFEPAVDLFEQAAQEGNQTAKFMLGYAYYKGFVVDVNLRQATKLIKEAAKASFDEAELVLANMYLNGDGITKNYGHAVKFYRAAAAQGNTEAMLILGDILAEGRVYPQNLPQAHVFYNIASVYGISQASDKRDALESEIQLEELLEAQTSAGKYRPKPSELTTYIRKTFGTHIRRYIDDNLAKQKGVIN